ncbi:SIR2 family protein [Providencia rettgeri]|uniref:SIR2 family protein n=1 Tax=Providencia rettgeri TaxID=587 RepID=UPI00235DF885|nr:SIR2 family protein [Providencia rettgeri]
MDNTLFFRSIYDAMSDKRLCLFVGAGISMTSNIDGVHMPSWSDLIDNLKLELKIDGEIDYLKLAELYHLQFGEYEYYRRLKSLLMTDAKPSKVHEKLLELKANNIITTNWDDLIEISALETFQLYDLIVTDEDLSKSTAQNKIIKMHGDFSHHNIVFKESDYINYEIEHPLMSNYIKGILSTNVVMFLGYSYSDINLKIIMSWVQKHSKARQPMYLITFSNNPTQNEYLKKQGITPIILERKNNGGKCSENSESKTKSYTKLITDFIDGILNYEKNKINLISESDKFLFEKLKCFISYDYILHEQIIKSIGNCGYSYLDNKTIFKFYKNILTNDYKKNDRKHHEKILNIISNNEVDYVSPMLDNVFMLFMKAGISGVFIDADVLDGGEYLEIDKLIEYDTHLEKVLTFDNKELDDGSFNPSTFSFYDLKKMVFKIKKILNSAIKDKHYNDILIMSYNLRFLNSLINLIKRSDDLNEEIKDVIDYYNDFPLKAKHDALPLFETLNDSFYYKKYYQVSTKLNKLKKNEYFDDIDLFRLEYINLLNYNLGNKIACNQNVTFKNLSKKYMEAIFYIETLRFNKNKNNPIYISYHECYSLITHYSSKELNYFFNDLSCVKSESKLKFTPCDINGFNTEEMLVLAISNLIECNLKPNGINDYFLWNAITVLSYIKIKESSINKTLELFCKLLDNNIVTIYFYECFNTFLINQCIDGDVSFEHDKINDIVQSFVRKLSENRVNMYDVQSISTGGLNVLYEVADKFKIKANVSNDIRILALKYEAASIRVFAERLIPFLISLYPASDENSQYEIKNIFKKFSNYIGEDCISYEYIQWCLYLVKLDFIETNEKLEKSFKEFIIGNNDGDEITKSLRIAKLQNLCESLHENNSISYFKNFIDQTIQESTDK